MDRIKNWKVHDEDYLSDHKMISFNLCFKKPATGMARNFKKVNWTHFKSLLSNKEWDNPPTSWSIETINTEAQKLHDDITQALDKVCPVKEMSTKSQPHKWWKHNLKKKVKSSYKDWKTLSYNADADQDSILSKYNTYKSVRNEYAKAIKDSKASSWRAFTSECEDIYALNKIIFKKQQNGISMMEGCNTGQKTNNILMDAHFPRSTPLDDTLQSTASQDINNPPNTCLRQEA